MKYFLIIILFLVVLMAFTYLINKNNLTKNDMKNIDLVLDVRTIDEWNAGHGKSAKNIPLDSLGSRINELENYKEKNVVVVCRSGARAGAAVAQLKSAGFKNVENGGPWQNFAE